MKTRIVQGIQAAAVVAIGLVSCGFGAAAHSTDAPAFVANLGDRVELVLSSGRSDTERETALRGFLDQVFDFPAISRFVLGPYWNSANEEQRREFASLFGRYIARICSSEMGDYTGHLQITVLGSHPEADTGVLVASQVVMPGDRPPTRVDWRISSDGDHNKITDIIVEGVSLVQTQRQQFTSMIRRNSGQVAPMLVQLRQTLGAN
jgi:phospholipid transport system substrate-binding protein